MNERAVCATSPDVVLGRRPDGTQRIPLVHRVLPAPMIGAAEEPALALSRPLPRVGRKSRVLIDSAGGLRGTEIDTHIRAGVGENRRATVGLRDQRAGIVAA